MKKIEVNNNCIGCGSCVSIANDVFEFNDEGYATVKKDVDISKVDDESVTDAAESCPVSAIETE